MKNIKEKLLKRAAKRELEKIDNGLPFDSDGEEREVDPDTDSSGSNTSLFGKVKSKLKRSRSRSKEGSLRKRSKSKSSTDGESDDDEGRTENTDTPVETSDESENTKDSWSKDYSTPTSQANSEWETDGEATEGKDLALDQNLAKPDEDAIKISGKKLTFNIHIRICDATGLEGQAGQDLNPMVRVTIGRKCLKTQVVRNTDSPHWDQTLRFSQKTTLEDLCSKNITFKVYSAGRIFGFLIGSFQYNIGLVYKSKGHQALGKWLALRSIDEDIGAENQIRGYLRVCIGVSYPGCLGQGPLRYIEDKCEIIDVADTLNYQLQFRLFKLLSILRDVRYDNPKTPDAPSLFSVQVMFGKKTVESEFIPAPDMSTSMNEELILPMVWPTVDRKVRIRLLARRHAKKKKRVVCTAFLDLKNFCQSGDNGFLPVFGPGFINLFGPDIADKDVKNVIKKRMRNGDLEGTIFYGRIFCAMSCVESKLDRPTTRDIPMSVVHAAEYFFSYKNFTLFCSFFAANAINPEFKSDNVQYAISIGEFGNPLYDFALSSTDRTLATMPIYDSTRFYAMPWGTHKPICEINCVWEDITPRIAQASGILRIRKVIKELQEEAEHQASNSSNTFGLVSTAVNAMEEAIAALHGIQDHLSFRQLVTHEDSMRLTHLDHNIENSRFIKFTQLQAKLEAFMLTSFDPLDIDENCLNRLTAIQDDLNDILGDSCISIPDVLIQMLVNGKAVAFTKIPIAEIFFNPQESKSGINCGKLKAFELTWLKTKRNSAIRTERLPSVVHARLWFGPSDQRSFWNEMLLPGKMRYYAELFVNERRKLFSDKFSSTRDKPFPFSDESGMIEMSEQAVRPPAGWVFQGDWRQQRTHDMYVGPEAGSRRFEDECFEVEAKDDDMWHFDGYTGYFGEPISSKELEKAPAGWTYEDKWEVDLYSLGGAGGWLYSIDKEFSEKAGACDIYERNTHKFRRRRLKRFRVLSSKASLWSMFEDVELFKKRCDESGWEYAKEFGKPLHMQQQRDDRFRRKRMLREICHQSSSHLKHSLRMGSDFISPRIYEVHDQISSFQLRVYVLWARELRCETPVSRSYVRVFFLHRCQETTVIAHTTNPIFNETLIFDDLLVCGGLSSIQQNPPLMVVEVIGEVYGETDVFFGRFHLAPHVVIEAMSDPPKIRWHDFSDSSRCSTGALLIYAEMYQTDPAKRRLLPKLPVKKASNRYEVPPAYRPAFVKYNVQMLCWGMRNLQRFKLTAIRQPWLEVSVADLTGQTLPLKDSKETPNFDDPLLTFHDIMMPEKLYYAPPIQIALFDRRIFGMKPEIGVCTISNFSKYLHAPQPIKDVAPEEWAQVESLILVEQEEEIADFAEFENNDLRNGDDFIVDPSDPNSPRIDWWCKYYFSQGEMSKAVGYDRLHLPKIAIFDQPLEDVGDYRGFKDFLDTFYFERKNRKRRRKNNRSKDICGELKGRIFIMRQSAKNTSPLLNHIPGAEFEGVVPCLVRVYVVRVSGLISCNKNGILDPFVTVTLGNQKKRCEYMPNTTNPVFGHLFEFKADIPRDTTLRITVHDKKRFFGAEEVGTTWIDLENRLLTKHRATVGLPLMYNLFGPLPWRDQLVPLEVLSRYCRKMGLHAPIPLSKNDDVGIDIGGNAIWLSQIEPSDTEAKRPTHLCGRPYQRLALFILHAFGLVPEHVETRPLYGSVNPDVEVGRLECFVDIFPQCLGVIPPPIDISPRQPDRYQLRIVVWRTRNVILMKRSFGKPVADLYVGCYLNGALKRETTDIHYRCSDGAGSFNWRFVIDFAYDPWEKQLVANQKKRFLRRAKTENVDPIIVFQICDNNKFKKDALIGELEMNLLGFEEPAAHEDELDNVIYPKERRFNCCIRCCRYCWQTRCCIKKRKRALVALPKAPLYRPGYVGIHSLFQQRHVRGWWPFLSRNIADEQKPDDLSRKKKDDDYDPNNKPIYVTGVVELEISLLTAEEAALEPVGRKRKKPNRNPFLPRPDRPRLDSYWFTSRCTACMSYCWRRWGCQVICGLICILVAAALIVSLVYQFPKLLVEVPLRIVGL